jgi:uncharacterized caspase-like protein
VTVLIDQATPATPAPRGPAGPRTKLIGLCIGVSRYKDARLNLRYAHRDAIELAGGLAEQRALYGVVAVASLTDAQATRSGILTAFDRLVAVAASDATAVVSFSGHGWRSGPRTFYFAPHDVDTLRIAATAVPWSAVVQRLTSLSQKCRRVIVLLDACHSGSAASNDDMARAVLGANAGVIVFSSSRGDEVSLEDARWQHGVFTKGLLEAMGAEAATNRRNHPVSLWDFVSDVRTRVRELSRDSQHPQVPFLQDFDADAPVVTTSNTQTLTGG